MREVRDSGCKWRRYTDADLGVLAGKTTAVTGCGNQGAGEKPARFWHFFSCLSS